jgi:hypothetical protein
MKKNALISLALTMLSGTALSHQIYYTECDGSASAEAARAEFATKKTQELQARNSGFMGSRRPVVLSSEVKCYSDQPEMRDLKSKHPHASESDRVAAMTFCMMGGYKNPTDCAVEVLNKGLADAARGCIDSVTAQVKKLAINPATHQAGIPGLWHQEYAPSQDDGMHRHDWSHEARDFAAAKYAVAKVQLERKLRESNSPTTSPTTGVLKQKDLDAMREKYYRIGYENPQWGEVNPDIYCERNAPDCITSSVKPLKNTYYQKHGPSGTPKPGVGSLWAGYGPGILDPMARCVFQKLPPSKY